MYVCDCVGRERQGGYIDEYNIKYPHFLLFTCQLPESQNLWATQKLAYLIPGYVQKYKEIESNKIDETFDIISVEVKGEVIPPLQLVGS